MTSLREIHDSTSFDFGRIEDKTAYAPDAAKLLHQCNPKFYHKIYVWTSTYPVPTSEQESARPHNLFELGAS